MIHFGWLIFGCVILLAGVFIICHQRVRITRLRKKLQEAQKTSSEVGSFMNLFSRNIRNVRDSDNWMNVTAHYVADTIFARTVCVFVVNNGNIAMSGYHGDLPRAFRKYTVKTTRPLKSDSHNDPVMAMLDHIIQTREDIFVSERGDKQITEIDPFSQINSFMAVPMMEDGKVIAVACAINSSRSSKQGFERDQFARFKFMSGQIVLSENIMKVYTHLSEQQRIGQELNFARTLQRSLLPQSIPVWGQFMIYAFSRASKEVSGDFYDFVEIDKDRLLVVIGDACGKGIPACLIMAMTRSFIRSNAERFTSLHSMLNELNDNLYHDMGDGRYITLGICLLNRKESTMEYARAGHTELLVYVREHIRTIYPDGAGLGLLPSDVTEFDTFNIGFVPGMELMLFTDGINEAVNRAGEYFGVERIKEILLKSCLDHDQPHDSIARIMGAVDEFSQNPNSQADDQTIVIIRHT